jgi:inorganic pyrophosphatase
VAWRAAGTGKGHATGKIFDFSATARASLSAAISKFRYTRNADYLNSSVTIKLMSNLAKCPNKWNAKKCEGKVIIETPKGRRNKFDYDPDFQMFALGGLLPEGLTFPFDFGFLPSTLGADGDPLDVIVLMDEPAHVGCLLDVRLIGVIEAEQIEDGETTRNDRLIGVSIHSYNHEHISSISAVNKSLLDQFEEFFISYNKSRGKRFKVKGRHGPKRAASLVKAGIAAFRKKK